MCSTLKLGKIFLVKHFQPSVLFYLLLGVAPYLIWLNKNQNGFNSKTVFEQ